MKVIQAVFANQRLGAAVRGLLRALLICLTAFGLKLDADQIAGLQLVLEAVLQVGVSLTPEPEGPPPADN